MNSLELAKEAAAILDNKKAEQVSILGIEDVTVIADYFVIATGNNSTHVKSLADEVEFKLKEKGIRTSHIEGHDSNSWILLDYSDIIVHIFSKEARNFYDLERLWKDAKVIDINENMNRS